MSSFGGFLDDYQKDKKDSEIKDALVEAIIELDQINLYFKKLGLHWDLDTKLKEWKKLL